MVQSCACWRHECLLVLRLPGRRRGSEGKRRVPFAPHVVSPMTFGSVAWCPSVSERTGLDCIQQAVSLLSMWQPSVHVAACCPCGSLLTACCGVSVYVIMQVLNSRNVSVGFESWPTQQCSCNCPNDFLLMCLCTCTPSCMACNAPGPLHACPSLCALNWYGHCWCEKPWDEALSCAAILRLLVLMYARRSIYACMHVPRPMHINWCHGRMLIVCVLLSGRSQSVSP